MNPLLLAIYLVSSVLQSQVTSVNEQVCIMSLPIALDKFFYILINLRASFTNTSLLTDRPCTPDQIIVLFPLCTVILLGPHAPTQWVWRKGWEESQQQRTKWAVAKCSVGVRWCSVTLTSFSTCSSLSEWTESVSAGAWFLPRCSALHLCRQSLWQGVARTSSSKFSAGTFCGMLAYRPPEEMWGCLEHMSKERVPVGDKVGKQETNLWLRFCYRGIM